MLIVAIMRKDIWRYGAMGTIFIAGIYGVGKSTLCQQLSKELNIPAYSAGDLISAINGEQYGPNKVVADKANNQAILALQVKKILTANPQILLAGHFCIFDKNNNVDYLLKTIFLDLKIESILILEAAIPIIIENLSARDRKRYTQQQILGLQNAEREKALEISNGLGCKINIHNMLFDGTDVQQCMSYIKKEG